MEQFENEDSELYEEWGNMSMNILMNINMWTTDKYHVLRLSPRLEEFKKKYFPVKKKTRKVKSEPIVSETPPPYVAIE